MYELRAKQHIRKIIFSKPVFACLLFFTMLTFKATWNMYSRWIESSDNLKNVAASVESLKGREAELVFEIDRLETARGVEEEIRKKYSVVKPGEEMVVVVDAPEPLVDNTEDEPGFLKRSWRKMKSWFSDEEDEADVKTE